MIPGLTGNEVRLMNIVETPVPTPAMDFVRVADDYLDAVVIQLGVWCGKVGVAPNGAAHQAVRDIDNALRALHTARESLVGELRRYDDECMERSGRLLEQLRAEAGER